CAEWSVRANMAAMREVAALDVLGCAIEFVDWAGDGARHPTGGKEREQFEHEKDDGDGEQDVAPDDVEVAAAAEHLFEQLRLRLLHEERDVRTLCAVAPVGRREHNPSETVW